MQCHWWAETGSEVVQKWKGIKKPTIKECTNNVSDIPMDSLYIEIWLMTAGRNLYFTRSTMTLMGPTPALPRTLAGTPRDIFSWMLNVRTNSLAVFILTKFLALFFKINFVIFCRETKCDAVHNCGGFDSDGPHCRPHDSLLETQKCQSTRDKMQFYYSLPAILVNSPLTMSHWAECKHRNEFGTWLMRKWMSSYTGMRKPPKPPKNLTKSSCTFHLIQNSKSQKRGSTLVRSGTGGSRKD